MKKVPILITYIHTQDSGQELRYTLRSLPNITNCDLNVTIVGDSEPWFTNINHISCMKLLNSSYADQVTKLYNALPHMPDTFIVGQDDIYITEQTEIGIYHQGKFKEFKTSFHQRTKKFTHDYLRTQGINPLDYECHVPMLVNKNKLTRTLELIQSHPRKYMFQWRSLYGNLNNLGGEFIVDKKIRDDQLIEGRIISTQRFIPELETLFPEPSRYEK